MYKISTIDTTDFFFNGHWASEFEIIVGGENGFDTFSLSPSTSDKEETIMGVDGSILVSSTYNPRSFAIPIYIQNSDRIREISKWLSVKTAQDFYFKNDTIKLKVKYDGVIDLKHFIHEGLTEIKFKAFSPYYTEVNPMKYSFATFNRGYSFIDPLTLYNPVSITTYSATQMTPTETQVVPMDAITLFQNADIICYTDGLITKGSNLITTNNTLSSVNFWNDGNVESRPLLKIYGDGNLVCGLNGYSFTINNVSGYVYVDFQYYTVYKTTSINMLPNFVGNIQDFNMLSGWNSISSTNATKIEITPRSKWI